VKQTCESHVIGILNVTIQFFEHVVLIFIAWHYSSVENVSIAYCNASFHFVLHHISLSNFTLSGKAHITNQDHKSRQIASHTYDDNEEIKPTFSVVSLPIGDAAE